MAYIGACSRHGQFVNQCSECLSERPLRDLAALIKAGMDPDKALEQVLKLKDEAAEKAERERIKKKYESDHRALVRAGAIAQFLAKHPELQDPDEVTY